MMRRRLSSIALLSLLMLPAASLHGQDPARDAGFVLRLNGQEYDVAREAPEAGAEGDVPLFRMTLNGDVTLLVHGRGRNLTRITDGLSKTIATLAEDLRENRRAVPLQELLWEALLVAEWERQGDALLKQARKGVVPKEALIAYERAIHPFFVSPRLYEKLAGPYLQLMKDRSTPRATLVAVASAIARWPESEEPAARGSQVALARGCAHFFLRGYPRAAEALSRAGTGGDAEGLREVLKVLGADRWSVAPREASGITRWNCESQSRGEGLPVYENAFAAAGQGATYYLTRRSSGTAEGYFLHRVSAADETLIEAYGAKKPSLQELEARIASEREVGPDPAARALIPTVRTLPPLGRGDPGRVEVRWEGTNRSQRLELRRDGLEAAVWLGWEDGSPVLIKGLAPGKYGAFLRDAQGRILREREVTVAPGEKSIIDVERF